MNYARIILSTFLKCNTYLPIYNEMISSFYYGRQPYRTYTRELEIPVINFSTPHEYLKGGNEN